jgi:hypothetical protein
MTNAKQIKQVFGPLAAQYNDLKQIGSHYLWLLPVRHVALRVLIDRSSHKDFCTPRWTMLETFIPGSDLMTSIGHSGYLHRPASSRVVEWIWSDPTMIEDLLSVIATVALPRLRAIDSLPAFWTVYSDGTDIKVPQWPEMRLIFHIALGDLDAARALYETLEPELRENRYPNLPWIQGRRRMVLSVAEPLLAGDRAALATILHGWEADNVRGTKLEPYWERTPFPLEAASA